MDTETALIEKLIKMGNKLHKLHDTQGQARKGPDRQRKNQYHWYLKVLDSTVTLMLTLPCQSPLLLFCQCWNTEPN